MIRLLQKILLFLTLIPFFSIWSWATEPSTVGREGRPVTNDVDRQYWMANMAIHQFTIEEMSRVLNLTKAQAKDLFDRSLSDSSGTAPSLSPPGNGEILILPYPGGRHPRIGFLDGAVRPQRETKVSIFAPWRNGGYLVLDLPEAVWHHIDDRRELLYLAHTHVPTIWDKQNIELQPLEWNRDATNVLSLTRELPNKVAMISSATVADGGVRLKFTIKNESSQNLTGLHVQVCGMLKGLNGFAQQSNDNKLFSPPFSACRNQTGKQWVILGFENCIRAWGNAQCPCLHSDPQVPDCAPGEIHTLHGWFSFFEGDDIANEFKRLENFAFHPTSNP